MTIVLLIRSLNVGGAQSQLVALAKALHEDGESVVVAVFYEGGSLLRELIDARVPVVVLGKRGRWDVIPFLARLLRTIQKCHPKVVYAYLVEPSLVATFLRPFFPKTRIVWGVRASNVNFTEYGRFHALMFQASRLLARFADLIIANSLSGAEYHRRRGYPASKLHVIPNGIDLDRFKPDPDAGSRARGMWGFTDQDIVVGMVGRLDPMKDHKTFLEAASILARQIPLIRFVCVGDGPTDYRTTLRERAANLGIAERVVWTGERQDMSDVYNALDVACLASAFGEGFSNVLGEAMACGVPCVATDVGDSARIIDACGEVVHPRDAQGFADGIRRTLNRSGPDLQRACRARIEKHYNLDRMVSETRRLLLTILDDSA